MKNILAISNHGTMLGGGEYSFFDFVSRLSKNWNILTLAPSEGELCVRLRQAGVPTQIVPLPSLRPAQVLKIFKSLKSIFALSCMHRVDLIYANGSRAAFYGGLTGRILHIPVVWHCRISEPDFLLDRVLIRLCNRIVANSRATAGRFPSHGRNKLEICYNGIDFAWFQEKPVLMPTLIKPDWKVILMVARISKIKRHDLAVAAFETLAQDHPDYHLVLIGDGDPIHPEWRKQLQGKTLHSCFKDRIHWIPMIADLRPWYLHAHILILPSENESFGRVLAEAMACGVPVIASRVGGIPEIVRHDQDGILFTPGNVEELTGVMQKITSDENLRRRLSVSAKERACSFDLERHMNQMIRIFKAMMHFEDLKNCSPTETIKS